MLSYAKKRETEREKRVAYRVRDGPVFVGWQLALDAQPQGAILHAVFLHEFDGFVDGTRELRQRLPLVARKGNA